MPKKLPAEVIAWAVAAEGPSLARNTAGRVPEAAAASTLMRSASKPAAQRYAEPGSGPSADGTLSSALGNSLTPMIGARRWSMSASRAARVAAMRSSTMPASTAARKPPAASTSWKTFQARSASSSVSRSTYHDPPAGSITLATFDSSSRTVWVLRASRGRQVARRSSNGGVVRQDGDRIGAADGGREAGDRGAHDVDGTVVAGRHRP